MAGQFKQVQDNTTSDTQSDTLYDNIKQDNTV